MKAVGIQLHNFRTFCDAEIPLSPYTLLVGANDCGKSNVIDAIRVFYEKGRKYEPAVDFPKFSTNDNESWVELEFKLSADERADLREKYDHPLRLRKYLQTSEKDDEGNDKTGAIYGYVDRELSNKTFYGWKNVRQAKLGDIIYVPAVSKLDEHTKLSGPSALRDLVNLVLKKIMGDSIAYSELKRAFDTFEAQLKKEKAEDGASLARLESEITAEIAAWKTSFQLLVNPIDADEIIKTVIDHKIQDDRLDEPLDSQACGEGFQRHLIFSLIRLHARYTSVSKPKTRKTFSPELAWILFEEPEAFLHPNQIDALDANLREISKQANAQVLVTTHSPRFVSRNMKDLPALIRLSREQAASEVRYVDAAGLKRILQTNQQDLAAWKAADIGVNEDDMQTDMEAVKYCLWLNPLRCGAFFAKKGLLVEGPTEVALIGYLLETGQIEAPPGEVFVLDTMGKWNTHRFMNLFGALGIPHGVILDQDGETPGNTAICETIEKSRNAYTLGIHYFDHNIESFLGIPSYGDRHRKPQHVMRLLCNKKIDRQKLQALAATLQHVLQISVS